MNRAIDAMVYLEKPYLDSVCIRKEWMKLDSRFDVVYREGSAFSTAQEIVLVDRETGVNYLFVKSGYAGGLTP